MKLALDAHYSPGISLALRERGHDVIAISERGWSTETEERLLELCHAGGRTLLTNNVGDFARIARRWSAEGRRHSGLLFTSDFSMPRARRTIGIYVRVLDEFLTAHPGGIAGIIRWIGNTERA